MAATAADTHFKVSAAAQASPSPNFGAYSPTASQMGKNPIIPPGTQANENTPPPIANDNGPAAKQNGSMAFLESDERWLKEFGITTAHPRDHQKVWATDADREKEQSLTWKETYKGRLAMRAVSRGVVGTLFYAAAQMYAGHALGKYKLHDTGDWHPTNMLEHIARIIDRTAGKGIQWTVKTITGDEEKAFKAIMFRDTINFGNKLKGISREGRSLGHEAVAVTFDFATMSFTDYMTRYFIGLCDPNARNAWIKDGHLQLTGALQDLFSNIFRGITYAAGEDMAVALPYVYYMRLQRHVINRFSPGFKYDSDLGLNGGSYKLNHENKIVGNYQLEGMLDLGGRFSWYNIGTKMFRDAYNVAENKIADWWNPDPKQQEKRAAQPQVHYTLAQKAERGARYVFRTTVKTMMYMIPSTFFFYMTRTPEMKFRGVAIHPEKGFLGRYTSKGDSAQDNTNLTNRPDDNVERWRPVKPTSVTEGEKITYRNHSEEIANPFNGSAGHAKDAFSNKFYNPNEGRNAPWHDIFTNPLGKLCYGTGSALTFLFKPLNGIFGVSPKNIEIFARTWANASWSYTPYFMMKTDIGAAALDTKRNDMAIDRFWHGLTTFDYKETKAGAGEIAHNLLHEPFSDPKREEKAQEKMLGDPEKRSNEAYQTAIQGKNDISATQKINTAYTFSPKESHSSMRPTYGTLRKHGEPWTEWLKPAELEKTKQQEGSSFSQSLGPRAPGWTASYTEREASAPLGQTVH